MPKKKINTRSSKTSEIFYPPVNRTLVKVLTDFLGQETKRFGITKCVIGLSGGIDSAVSVYLSAKAFGPKNVTALILPYKESSPDSVKHALEIVKATGIKSSVINITKPVDALIEQNPKIDKVRKGNILARMRMICLYDYSNQVGGLVIGTSNKTEALLGYTTLFGDAAYAINPLGDLYKTQVWQLAELLGIPKHIVKKKPSADLWAGQTDEAELGFRYKEVDRFLYYLVDCRFTDAELITEGFKPAFIKAVKEKIRRNQFKRVPPPFAKVSNRTINIDYRYNRDWGT